MNGWVGPTIALSLVLIAFCTVGVLVVALFGLREVRQISISLAIELECIRRELAESLGSLKRLSDQGQDVIELTRAELTEIIHLTRRLRHDIERGVKRTKRRLADFEAVVEVVQEEVEETALDFGATLRTVRSGRGMIGQLSRLVRPRRRGAA